MGAMVEAAIQDGLHFVDVNGIRTRYSRPDKVSLCCWSRGGNLGQPMRLIAGA